MALLFAAEALITIPIPPYSLKQIICYLCYGRKQTKAYSTYATKSTEKNRTSATAVAPEKMRNFYAYRNNILNAKIISPCGFSFRYIWRHVILKGVYRLSPLDNLTYTPFQFGRLAAVLKVKSKILLLP